MTITVSGRLRWGRFCSRCQSVALASVLPQTFLLSFLLLFFYFFLFFFFFTPPFLFFQPGSLLEVRKAGIHKAGLASSVSKMRSRGSSVKSKFKSPSSSPAFSTPFDQRVVSCKNATFGDFKASFQIQRLLQCGLDFGYRDRCSYKPILTPPLGAVSRLSDRREPKT